MNTDGLVKFLTIATSFNTCKKKKYDK